MRRVGVRTFLRVSSIVAVSSVVKMFRTGFVGRSYSRDLFFWVLLLKG